MSNDSNVDGDTITAYVDSAQPGRWRVRFDFVSATDGHRYGSSYSFTIKGERDCDQEEGEEEGKMGSGDRSGDDDMASSSQSGGHSDGQSVPVAGLVAASAVALATGLIARLRPRMR